MTVREMIELLSKMDQDKQVVVWCGEWDCTNPIDEVSVNEDGEVVIY